MGGRGLAATNQPFTGFSATTWKRQTLAAKPRPLVVHCGKRRAPVDGNPCLNFRQRW
jgi:hypothetical protein